MNRPIDLSTPYVGLTLDNPFIVGASPLTDHLDTARQLEDAGWAALVVRSLFEEQITAARSGRVRHLDPLDEQFAPVLSYFPRSEEYVFGPDEYLEHLRRLKAAVHIPVFASLNGTTAEEWLTFSKAIEQAGADGIELNTYEVVPGADRGGLAVEREILDMVRAIEHATRLPIVVKLTPFFTALGHLAYELEKSGARGLVLFNRFYQPDFDIERLAVTTNDEPSTPAELLLRLRWTALLYGRLRASLTVCGGVAQPTDAIKAILAGASAVQIVSAVMRNGADYVHPMRDGLARWMERHTFRSLADVRGRLSAREMKDPAAFERASYLKFVSRAR